MPEVQWGERRAHVRQRARRRWIAGIAALLLASPFALTFAAERYAAGGGTMPDGRFPLWIPLLYWTVVIAVAVVGVTRLYRHSDEFERRRLIDGFAASGLIFGLLTPPLYALGYMFWMMLLWMAAFAVGIAVFALRRSAP